MNSVGAVLTRRSSRDDTTKGAINHALVRGSNLAAGSSVFFARVLSVLMVMCIGLSVNTGVYAKDMKIAVLDYAAAMAKSSEAQKMSGEIKKDLKKEEKKILKLEDQLHALSEKAERDGPVMSDSQKEDLLKDIEDKKLDYSFLVKKIQKRQKEGQEEIIKALQPTLSTVIETVVKDGGYDLVIERRGVVFISPSYDITDDVVAAMNKVAKNK